METITYFVWSQGIFEVHNLSWVHGFKFNAWFFDDDEPNKYLTLPDVQEISKEHYDRIMGLIQRGSTLLLEAQTIAQPSSNNKSFENPYFY